MIASIKSWYEHLHPLPTGFNSLPSTQVRAGRSENTVVAVNITSGKLTDLQKLQLEIGTVEEGLQLKALDPGQVTGLPFPVIKTTC
jgi:hypothetical protein